MNQSKALAILKSGRNVFLTGAAGTGKTWLLLKYIKHLRTKDIRIAITASTGIAATHLNGQTIHSWSGMGVRDSIDLPTLKKIYKYRHLRKNMDKVKVLIIDEISMLHKNQFTMLDKILRFFKGIEAPFGGIQIILTGDFFQLPPISNHGETSQQKFVFMSDSWVQMNPVICYLTEQYRQNDDKLVSLLDAIRNRNIDQNAIDNLEQAVSELNDEDVLHLYTHNKDVDSINQRKLEQLDGKEYRFNAETQGKQSAIETLTKQIIVPNQLRLKQHARVLFVKNNPEAGYMNGTLARVCGFTKKSELPLVMTDDGVIINVEQETWSLEDDEGKSLATYKQIPLRLAWAITVHKSQGMSLDRAHVDINHAFEAGQGYVALSRLRNFDGLSLVGFNPTALQVDPLAYKADLRFRKLSKDSDDTMDEAELQQEADKFIVAITG